MNDSAREPETGTGFNPPGMLNRTTGLFLVNIPKNGSTSIRMSFGLTNHVFLADVDRNAIKVVAVIRNPLDRIASSFLEILKRPSRDAKGKPFIRMARNKDQFVRFVDCLIEDGVFDQHAMRQSDRLLCPDGKMYDFDYLILFDRFSWEVDLMSSLLGIGIEVGHNNSSSSDSVKEIREWILNDEELKKKVIGFYAEDWRIYNEVLELRSSSKQK